MATDKQTAGNETAIDPFAVDLDAGQEMPPIEPLSKGWHKFYLVDYEFVVKDDGKRPYLRLDVQHDETGYKRSAFLSWPQKEDYHTPLVKKATGEPIVDRNGEPVMVAGSLISVIKTVISALGGPESGKISIDSFAQLIGRCALFLVGVQEYPEGSGEFRDRIDLAFGKGIKPC